MLPKLDPLRNHKTKIYPVKFRQTAVTIQCVWNKTHNYRHFLFQLPQLGSEDVWSHNRQYTVIKILKCLDD